MTRILNIFLSLFDLGHLIVRFFGSLVRWVFTGFRLSFKRIWDGPDTTDVTDRAAYGFITNILGIVFLFLVFFLAIDILKL